MRILYFSRGYSTHDRRFLAALATSSHDVWYLRLEGGPSPYEPRPLPEGIRELTPLAEQALPGSPDAWVRLVPRLEAAIARAAPDVVHAGPVQSCAFLAALTGFRPLLAMSWGSDLLVDAARDEFWAWVTRYTLSHSAMVVTDCAEVSHAALRIGGLDPQSIVEFPWGVDLDRFHPGPDSLGLRLRPGWKDAVIVLSTRSWEPAYGVPHLLEAFSLAHRNVPALRLALLGSGSERERVERFCREHGLQEAVWLAGAVPTENLPDYFRAADLYASCAVSDGSSISLLEAMATGLPALVTDRPSNREWIAGESQGRLARFGDVPAIAAALQQLAAASPETRRAMGERNRATAVRRADWKRNVAMLMAAYDRLRLSIPPPSTATDRESAPPPRAT